MFGNSDGFPYNPVDSEQSKLLAVDNIMEYLFKISKRKTSIRKEITCGLIHFLTTVSVLAINSVQLGEAGYEKSEVATATALCCAITCIIIGIIGNLPFIATPTLACSIYYSVFLKNFGISPSKGNTGVLIFGVLLCACSYRQISNIIQLLMPKSIQLGICLGLSLLISLLTLFRLGIVVQSTATVLSLGGIWKLDCLIAIICFILIGALLHHRVKGAFVIGMLVGSIAYWTLTFSWPTVFFSEAILSIKMDLFGIFDYQIFICVIDLFLISVVLVSGLSSNLAILAELEKPEGTPPRHRWLFFACGVGSIFGALFGAGPTLVSAESAVGIISGARTGLSSIVCGLLFLLCMFWFPFWSQIPLAGTSPVLLMVSVFLFENSRKVCWECQEQAIVVFVTAIISGFTSSVLNGVVFGFGAYWVMSVITGSFSDKISKMQIISQTSDFKYVQPLEGGYEPYIELTKTEETIEHVEYGIDDFRN